MKRFLSFTSGHGLRTHRVDITDIACTETLNNYSYVDIIFKSGKIVRFPNPDPVSLDKFFAELVGLDLAGQGNWSNGVVTR